jgi:hypothetical protein
MPTFTQIGSAVVVGSGGATEMDFTSIPATYTDLVLKISARSNRAAANIDEVYLRINGNTGNFSNRYLQGNGSAASSSSGSFALWTGYCPAASATASTFSNSEIYIPNYAGSNNKSMSIDTVQEDNSSVGYQTLHANLWNVTSAITSLRIYPLTGSFVQHSTAYLYGVSNA